MIWDCAENVDYSNLVTEIWNLILDLRNLLTCVEDFVRRNSEQWKTKYDQNLSKLVIAEIEEKWLR